MIPVINDIDRILQAAPSRYGEAYDPELRLSASAPGFVVALDATVNPSEIVFIASRVGMGVGPVEFSTDTGVPLAVDGDVARLLPAAMLGPACTVIVRQMWQGQQYVDRLQVGKTLAFDASKPPAPTGLATAGTLASIQLSWAPTNNTNIGKVEVWRALSDDLDAAVPVGETAGLGRSFTDAIGAAGSFFYWLRYVSKANVPGPFNAEAGTLGATGTGAEHLLELLENQITESELFGELRARIDLVDAEGTGLVDRVEALVETYGDTASSAESAAAAAEAAEEAIAAKAAAMLAAGDSVGAAQAANTSRLAADSSNQAAGSAAGAASTAAQNASSYAGSAEAAAGASNTAKLAAEAARGGAETAASAAATARDTAVAKAGEAGQSATSASTSANTATTKAGDAAAAATRAATSESNAAGSASSASTSATNAANSASAVGGSATAAAGSASTAATHAGNAGNSATAANAAKVAAESARDAAAGSASAASTSASTASTKAGDAGTYANAASASANTANTAAGNALTYRNSAAQSATDAQGFASASAQDYSAINARLNNYGGTGVSVEQKIEASASEITGLRGQYTVKIDNNGYVTGYGLASSYVNGVPTSAFIINADRFAVVAPGVAPKTMFSVGTLNGQTVIGFGGTLIAPSGTLGDLHLVGGVHGGAYTSFASPAAGTGTGFYFGPEGATWGNYHDGRYTTIYQNGDIDTPKFKVVGGVVTAEDMVLTRAKLTEPEMTSGYSVSIDDINSLNNQTTQAATIGSGAHISNGSGDYDYLWSFTAQGPGLLLVSSPSAASATIRSEAGTGWRYGWLSLTLRDRNTNMTTSANGNVRIQMGSLAEP